MLKFKSFTRLYTTFLSFYQCMESLGPKEVRLWCTTQLYFDRRRLEDDFPSRPSPYRPPPCCSYRFVNWNVVVACWCRCWFRCLFAQFPSLSPTVSPYRPPSPSLSPVCQTLVAFVSCHVLSGGTYTILTLVWRLPLQLQLAMFVRLSASPPVRK